MLIAARIRAVIKHDLHGMASTNGEKANPSQVSVNGTGLNPTAQNEITLALLHNGGMKRIEATLRQRLDEAGWSQDLKQYITRLFRSGTATTYDDVFAVVMKNINTTGAATNGTASDAHAPDLRIPREALEGGADAVKRELTQVVKPRN